MENIRMPREKVSLNLEDIRAADANTVAASFLSWLGMENGGQIQTETMRHSYAKCLTARIICRDLLASAYDEKYNLYDYRGLDAVNTILQPLEQTKEFAKAKRSSGESGIFQASFNKYKMFWEYLEEGGTINRDAILAASRFVQTMQQENIPYALPLQEAVDAKGGTLEEQILEIVLKSHYIVLETLSRVIRPDLFLNVQRPNGTKVTRNFMASVKRVAEGLCKLPNAQIGKLEQADAHNFRLKEDVYYSVEWVTAQRNKHDTLTIAGVIGLSLYDETEDFVVHKHRESGKFESAFGYGGLHDWLCKRNHQEITSFTTGVFYAFIGYFMKMKVPYAFRLTESVENDQTISERQRMKMVKKGYEWLARYFKYEPAVQKLKDIEARNHPKKTAGEELLDIILAGLNTEEPPKENVEVEDEEINPALRDMTSEQVRAISVSELNLSVRASNCLANAGIKTIGELLDKSADDLRNHHNFGRKSIEEIRAQLAKVYLHLRGEG